MQLRSPRALLSKLLTPPRRNASITSLVGLYSLAGFEMSMGSEEAVLQALQCACSQDPSVLKAGEQQLDAWKTQKGFYSVLAVGAFP